MKQKLILSDEDKTDIYIEISHTAFESGKPILRSEENLMRVVMLVTESVIIKKIGKDYIPIKEVEKMIEEYRTEVNRLIIHLTHFEYKSDYNECMDELNKKERELKQNLLSKNTK